MVDSGGSCGRVLIVDDDAGIRALVTAVLEIAGFHTEHAATAEEALARCAGSRPDAIVLDVALPGMSGYGLCRLLREHERHDLGIVFLSGSRVEAVDRVAGLMLGADDYMTKPFLPDELVARVRAVLRRTATERAAGPHLTEREQEVLTLLSAGLRRRDIAERLVISPKTVGTHVEHILSKLEVRSTAQAVAVAYRDALIADR